MRNTVILAAILLCACGPSLQSGDASGVNLAVEPREASSGETVTLVLRNGSAAEVGYNLCSSALEHLVTGDWRPVPSERVCTMELRMLPAGEEARYPIELPADLSEGAYRFVTNVDMAANAEFGPVRSDTLRIVR